MKIAFFLIAMVLAGACAGRAAVPPAIVMDRSACSRCGMLISEKAYAAAIRFPDGHDQLFDDIGCLVAAVREKPAAGSQYWFHDGVSGDWITDVAPVFAVSSLLRTPMAGGIVAYRDPDTAKHSVEHIGGRVVREFSELLTMERSSR
jgi:copper chaperone NosL